MKVMELRPFVGEHKKIPQTALPSLVSKDLSGARCRLSPLRLADSGQEKAVCCSIDGWPQR